MPMMARRAPTAEEACGLLRILVLGGDGMLGHKVVQRLSPTFETYATFRTPHGMWEEIPFYKGNPRAIGGVDAMGPESVAKAIRKARADAVINCIGLVKQRKEAQEPIEAISVNALFPHRLSVACSKAGARLIQVSTDCVFSGRKGRYGEEEVPDPEDLYGRTKLLGEVAGPNRLTLRTSLIGREFVGSFGLIEWFLSRRGSTLKGYRNAIFSGLTTDAFARILGRVLEDHRELEGLYHVASEPISKYDLLSKIKDAAGLDLTIEPSDEPRLDRSLDGSRFLRATGIAVPSWDAMISALAKDDTPYDTWRKRHGTA